MGRQKQEKLIVTFASTAAALQTESCCRKQQLVGRLIPVPREIAAGCGLAWCTLPEHQEALCQLARAQKIAVQAYHCIWM